MSESKNTIYPLTSVQRGIYFECLENPDALMYNIGVLMHLPVKTDAKKFIDAAKTVINSHKIFKSSIDMVSSEPVIKINDIDIEITEKTVSDIDEEMQSLIKPFDMSKAPLCEFELCRTNDELAFIFNIHHIIFDGSSIKFFAEQIADAYCGRFVPSDDLGLFDFAVSEQGIEKTDEYKAAQEYFSKKLDGVDCDSIPVPDVLVDSKSTDFGRLVVSAEDKFSIADIEGFTKEHNISANAFFLGVFAYTLAKFNCSSDSFFCTVHNGRHSKEIADSFGMFVRTFPLYFTIDEDMPTIDFLKNVYDDYYNSRKNDCIYFSELAEKYGASMDVSFVYHGKLFDNIPFDDSSMAIELADVNASPTKLDTLILIEDNKYNLLMHYIRSLYTDEFANNFAKMYLNVAKSMLIAEKLSDIKFTDDASEAEIRRINKTEEYYDNTKTVIDLFREQVKRTPNNICLVFEGKKYTYAEVDDITDRLAAHLVKNGVGKEKTVGILIPRCEHMLLCSLGVLKAGGAYVPLDPSYPEERLNLMMRDSEAVILISTPELSPVISTEFNGIRMFTKDIEALPKCDIELPTPSPSDLFIMIYTSGSTGTPKGVMVEHSNISVMSVWVQKYFSLDTSSHLAEYASFGFDASTFDIFPSIISGTELHIIAEDIRLDFIALRKYFNDNKITHTVMTAQIGRQFALMGGFETLRHLSVAGEKLTPFELPENLSIYNLYGPTEASVVTSAFKIDKHYRDIPIGYAVDNLKLYVTDKLGRLLPMGAVGELCVAGPHVTRCYKNRPEKTKEAYGENTFCSDLGYERLYRTGDIVRLLNDGNLQFVGRRDAQVKIRGFRVELTEIEEVIRRFDGIKDATVAAFDDAAGGKFLAAYVVSDKELSTEAIKDFIHAEKPPYMVPAVIMQIDKIPLSQNQKVNKRALPVPQRDLGDVIPPENETQQKIFDIISEIIGHTEFGITTDIYDAGLTSIGAVKLNVQLSEAFSVPVRIADIKSHNTVKRLEEFLSSSSADESYEVLADYPLTEAQNGIFIECMANPKATVYNIPMLLSFSKKVDITRLCEAIKNTVNAHPYIKTTLFTDKNGDVRAKRNDDAEVKISVTECDVLPDNSAFLKPFDLFGGQLYGIEIYKTPDKNYLFMNFHHIICDGTSENVIFADINAAYGGAALKKERFSGFEAALSEQETRRSSQYDAAKAYWKELLSGCETACLPKKDSFSNESGAGNVYFESKNSVSAVTDFCSKHKLTQNAFFNAATAFVLSRFTGQESLTYATVYNGRTDSRLAKAVMLLARTMPVCVNFKDEITVTDYIKEIQSQLISSMANDACSFAELAHEYKVNADVILVYQGAEFKFNSLCEEEAELLSVTSETAKAPISISIFSDGDSYKYTIEYKKDIYTEAFIKCLADSIAKAAIAFTKTENLKNVSLLTENSEKMYGILNSSDTETENIPFHKHFEKCAAQYPDKKAVVANGEELTYTELNQKANIVANNLIKLGVKADTIVGLVLERTTNISVFELAVLKAGGAFLPMLPDYPDERIDFCLENSGSPFVITTETVKAEHSSIFNADKAYMVLTAEELTKGENTKNPDIEISPDSLSYCIYTSGSTGTPKGVMIEHKNLANFIETQAANYKYYTSNSDGSAIAISSISFDMSIMELCLPLAYGKTLCIATDEEIHNPLMFRDLMQKNKAEMIICTPSFMSNIVSMPEFAPAISGLKTLLLGAEAFPGTLYKSLIGIAPDIQIVNGYGPTEATICCSVKELHSDMGITIGRPTGNVKMYVLDKFGNILPPYGVGELIICGEGVGRGYVKLPEKNAECFFNLRGLPAYHSGDLVRLNGDSEIDFSGRMDNQIKLRGFRVELDEIEKVMTAFSGIAQSKVVVRNNGSEDYLAGFFTASEKVDIDELTAFLKSRLTYYMVPSVIMQLDRMPLTQNGKIDKKALPETTKTTTKKSSRRAAKKSLEQKLCDIFCSVLGVDEVFADDNFFELGGTSLSASKVTMMLMSEDIEIKYGDIFDHATPEELAEFIEKRDKKSENTVIPQNTEVQNFSRPALQYNLVKYAKEVKREGLGNVLLTGTVGFLGIHILKELLEIESGHIYCLVRKGKHDTALIRLKTMLFYYFSDDFDDAIKNRITVIDADITDPSLDTALDGISFDTVINCAACVKHFADDDILERINVHGVENLIELCKKRNCKLIQISTVSVPGIHTEESYEQQLRMHENELFTIDDMDNKYIISKRNAENKIFDAIEQDGLRAKVIRVGNLMGRHSDGEFQVNLETNMFLSGIRGFVIMGKYPISHMTDPMSFSPVDCTARAVVLLAGTNDKFTAFNANNRYGFDEMKIIDSCNRNGLTVLPESDDKYYEEFRAKLGDDDINDALNGLAAYDIKDAHSVETDNLFTTNILYRIGFSWPLVDDEYLDKSIYSIMTLDYFNMDDTE